MRSDVRKALIWAGCGVIFAILINVFGENTSPEYLAICLVFWPVYFVGLGFCKWNLVLKIFLGIVGFSVIYETIIRRDRFHIASTMAGAAVCSYIFVIGWVVGLIRFVAGLFRPAGIS